MTKKSERPTESEVEILSVLWTNGPSTVREVHDQLKKSRSIGYTTVLKLMQIMFEKNLLLRDDSQRSHVYRPRQKAEKTQKTLVKHMLSRVFSGSVENLVVQALSAKKATPEELAQIRRMLDEMEDQ